MAVHKQVDVFYHYELRNTTALIILDRFSLNNANGIIFAQSGSGKSYTTKVEILRQLMQGTGVSIISQQANDFLTSEYGKAIASQSSLRILMKQDTTTIKRVAEEFSLSEYEQKFLLTCDRGEALIIADQNHVAIKSQRP